MSLPFVALSSDGALGSSEEALSEGRLDVALALDEALGERGASVSDQVLQAAMNVAINAASSFTSALHLAPSSHSHSHNHTTREMLPMVMSDESKAFSALSFRVRLSRHCTDEIRDAEALPSGFQVSFSFSTTIS